MMSGAGDLVKKPPSFPYIPGGDLSGVVVAVNERETEFKVGDRVLATWDAFGINALAEYALVDRKFVAPMPTNLNFVEGAAVIDSTANGMLAVEDAGVKEGDRVLLLGAAGGIGTAILQFLKQIPNVHVSATTTAVELAKSLGADEVVDYTKESWSDRYRGYAFDVVIDCAEGVSAWDLAREKAVIKKTGHWLAVVVNEWHIEIHNIWQMITWFAPVVKRSILSRMCRIMPKWTMMFPAPRGDSTKRMLKKVADGEVKVIIDGVRKFDTEGVVEAFDTMIARKGHGKVVIQVIPDED